MEYIYHEKQEGSLCAQHCLNALLQGEYYSAVDLADIAQQLDRQEHQAMSEAGVTKDYERFINQDSSNYDDSGFFSIQVLQKALEAWSLSLVPEGSERARDCPAAPLAYILNFKEHWYTIRQIASYWFNLNSMLTRPELITDTYLSILLAQLKNDGYSIFIVVGDLPRSAAEQHLREKPLNVKEEMARNKAAAARRASSSKYNDDSPDSDEELKRALRQSLMENDAELDALSRAKPKYKLPQEDDEAYEAEIRKACAMSLLNAQSMSNVTKETNRDSATTSVASKDEPETSKLNPEEIRNKRLRYLDKLSNEQTKPTDQVEIEQID